MTAADRAFYEPWWARLRASYSKPQAVQDRLHARFMAAAHAREAIQLQARREAEAAERRVIDAARKRNERARDRERR